MVLATAPMVEDNDPLHSRSGHVPSPVALFVEQSNPARSGRQSWIQRITLDFDEDGTTIAFDPMTRRCGTGDDVHSAVLELASEMQYYKKFLEELELQGKRLGPPAQRSLDYLRSVDL